jgi:hypothetical protein
MGATCLPELISYATGYSAYSTLLDLSLGIAIEIEDVPIAYQPAAVHLLASSKSGLIVEDVHRHLNTAMEEDRSNVLAVVCDYKTGDRVDAFRTGQDRLGYVMTKGKSAHDAARRAQIIAGDLSEALVEAD